MKRAGKELDIINLLDKLPAGVVVHEMDTSIIYANEEALKILRLTWDQIIGKKAMDPHWNLICENGKRLAHEDYPVNVIINSKQALNELIVGIVNNNQDKPTWTIVNGYIDTSGSKERIVITFTDITERFQLPFQEVVDKARDAVVITEAGELENPMGPKIVYVNDLFCKFTGYSKEEVIGKTPRILQGEDTDKEALKRIKIALQNEQSIRETIINYNKKGEPYWLDISIFPLHMNGGDEVTHFAAIERDVSDSKKKELEHAMASITDPLTNLLNRRGFEKQYNKLSKGRRYSIVVFDIDYFKKINDKYGHLMGDKVLQELAKIFQEVSRQDDLCARFGGEEFIVLLQNTNQEDAYKLANRVRELVQNSVVEFNDEKIQYTISAGVCYDDSGKSLEQTIKNADEALYKAKDSGRNKVIIYK